MSVLYKQITSAEFTAGLKKVGEFYSKAGKSNERLIFARFKEKVDKELEIFNSISRDLSEAYVNEFNAVKTELEKQILNQDASKKQDSLNREKCRLKVRLTYDFVDKTDIDGNDLCALIPVLVGVKKAELEEVSDEEVESEVAV